LFVGAHQIVIDDLLLVAGATGMLRIWNVLEQFFPWYALELSVEADKSMRDFQGLLF
jgi:hypothetical protein